MSGKQAGKVPEEKQRQPAEKKNGSNLVANASSLFLKCLTVTIPQLSTLYPQKKKLNGLSELSWYISSVWEGGVSQQVLPDICPHYRGLIGKFNQNIGQEAENHGILH